MYSTQENTFDPSTMDNCPYHILTPKGSEYDSNLVRVMIMPPNGGRIFIKNSILVEKSGSMHIKSLKDNSCYPIITRDDTDIVEFHDSKDFIGDVKNVSNAGYDTDYIKCNFAKLENCENLLTYEVKEVEYDDCEMVIFKTTLFGVDVEFHLPVYDDPTVVINSNVDFHPYIEQRVQILDFVDILVRTGEMV